MPPDPTTERKGINAVEKIFLDEFGWLFREQPVSDYGIDAQVEVVENNKPTGKLIRCKSRLVPPISGPAATTSFFMASCAIWNTGRDIPCRYSSSCMTPTATLRFGKRWNGAWPM